MGDETVPIIFDTFDSNGASVTMTGLAVTDIEVYKGASVTQRSSDSGYALIDTDGIDIDGATGIHGFTVDLSDNTDTGFFATGNDYFILVNAVTVDSQTVRFIAARFSIQNRYMRGTDSAATATSLATAQADLDTITGADGVNLLSATQASIDAIEADTAELQGDWVNGGRLDLIVDAILADTSTDGVAISATTANAIADALLNRDMSAVSDTTARSPLNALRFLRNKYSVAGSTLTVTKEDDSTSAWTSTLTSDAAADPVTGSDPA
ncbi:hypothetical protein OAO65_02225 [Flavobacteriales bacterium]|nr:hypothetical protein [Flavobacteriales bacterium]